MFCVEFLLPARLAYEAAFDVLGALARAELDHARVGEPFPAERNLRDDCLDLLPAVRDRDDDAAVARDLAAGDDEVSRRVVLLEEPPMGRHAPVDLVDRRLLVLPDG